MITKDEIESFINTVLEDAISDDDLDEAIKLCLADLSNMNLLEGSDDSVSLEDGDLVIAYPDDYKDLLQITLSDASEDYEPLKKFPGGHKEYKQQMANSTTTGIPRYFSEYNSQFFLYPPPDGDYDVLIEYYKTDAQDPDNIEFGNVFRNCIKFGALVFYAGIKNRASALSTWGPKYQEEKEMRRLCMPKQPYIVE